MFCACMETKAADLRWNPGFYFETLQDSILKLSYNSNNYPDSELLNWITY